MAMRIWLAGAPNVGKSALFGVLTGRRAVSGNREGVTVADETASLAEKWTRILGVKGATVTDLPGIRELPPQAPDEALAVRALERAEPHDTVLVVADAERLPEGLRLFAALREQLGSKSIHPVLVINRCDRLHPPDAPRKEGSDPVQQLLDEVWLSARIGSKAIGVSAQRRWGIDRLLDTLRQSRDDCTGCNACSRICDRSAPYSPAELIRHADSVAAQALLGQASPPSPGLKRLDHLLTHGFSGISILLTTWLCLLALAFGAPGNALCDLMETGVSRLIARIAPFCPAANGDGVLHSLWQEGVCGGVGAVLSFLPRLVLLWVGMQALEQCGYLPRAARLVHPFMQRLGLTGDALIPLLLGFGCTVPAAMSTRTLPEAGVRQRVLCLLPQVACSARLPVLSLLAQAFFPDHSFFFCASLYILSATVTLGTAWILAHIGNRHALRTQTDRPLPPLRFPDLRTVSAGVGLSLAHFVRRVCGILLLSSLLSWLLLHTSTKLTFSAVGGEQTCLLFAFGRMLRPLLAPLGLEHPALGAALLAGTAAKESVASVLAICLDTAGTAVAVNVPSALAASGWLTPCSALAFAILLTFSLPCTAALGSLFSESGKPRTPLFAALILSVLIGWILARLWVTLAAVLGL